MYGYVHEGHDSTLAAGSSVPLAAGRDQGLLREGKPRGCPSVVTTGQIQLGVSMRRVFSLAMAMAIVLSFGFSGFGESPASAARTTKDVYVASYGGIARVPGACLQLSPYSNVGCDVNRDGYVQFAAIPAGEYTLVYTSVPSGYALPANEPLTVPSLGTGPFYWNVQLASTTGTADVSIIAYDVADASRIAGACFSLRGYSNVGCDVNGDGQVEFADVAFGEYLIDVVRYPAGTSLAFPDSQDSIYVSEYSGTHWEGSVTFTYD